MWVHEVPFLRVFIPFAAGVAQFILYPLSSRIWIWAELILFLLMAFLSFMPYRFHFRFGHHFTYLSIIFFFCCGSTLGMLHHDLESARHFSKQQEKGDWLLCEAEADASTDQYLVSIPARVLAIQKGREQVPVSGKLRLKIESELASDLKYGNRFLVRASQAKLLTPPMNPDEFNYKQHLAYQQVYHSAYLKNTDWIILDGRFGNIYQQFIWSCKRYGIQLLNRSFTDSLNRGVAYSLLMGERSGISDELQAAYSGSGTVHVLSVSGLHLAVLFMLLNQLLRPVKGRKWRILRLALLLLFIWSYACITGLSPSVLRSATMFSFICIAQSINRQMNMYNSILMSAFFLLVWNPFLLMDTGFQLSYLAVIGIVFFYPRINKLLYRPPKPIAWLWSLVSVSIAAQISTTALSIFHFHQFPNLFLPANLIIVPLSSIILYLGTAFFAFSFWPFAKNLIAYVLDILIECMNYLVLITERIPFSVSHDINFGIQELLISYLALLLIIFFLQREQKRICWFIALTALLIFAFSPKEQGPDQLCLYSIRNSHAMELISNGNCYQLVSGELLSDPNKLKYHQYGYRLKSKHLQLPTIALQDRSASFNIGNLQILYIRDELPKEQWRGKHYNYVFISGKPSIYLDRFIRQVNCEQLVLLNDADRIKARYWRRDSRRLHLPLHDLQTDGALRIYL